MERVNLFWAIVWSAMLILCVVAVFWNPSHYATMLISAVLAGMFWYDYAKLKTKK